MPEINAEKMNIAFNIAIVMLKMGLIALNVNIPLMKNKKIIMTQPKKIFNILIIKCIMKWIMASRFIKLMIVKFFYFQKLILLFKSVLLHKLISQLIYVSLIQT